MAAKIELNEEHIKDLVLHGYNITMLAKHFDVHRNLIASKYGHLIEENKLKLAATLLEQTLHHAKKDWKALEWLLDRFVAPYIDENKQLTLRQALELVRDELRKPGATIDGVLAEAHAELPDKLLKASANLL